MNSYISLILFSVLTNFTSQILLKKGMSTVDRFEISISGFLSSVMDIMLNWFIISGLLVMAVSMASHLMVLSRVDISYAYPFLGLSFVLITMWGYFVLNEAVTFWRILGVLLICAGIAVVARN